MPEKPVYVLDANVIVSAVLLPHSVPRKAFDRACKQGQLAISEEVVNEIDEVLRRPRLNKYIHEEERIHFLMELLREAQLFRVACTVSDCRDPKDNKCLELAITSKASCIVSGDKDLLVLSPFRKIPVLTPSEFLNL